MTLIDEADEKVILVSPYFKIQKWYKLVNKLSNLKARGIEVEIYVRENETDSINEVMGIGFTPLIIPNLHTKLYLNEKEAIVSSMNLLLSSDTNSLDIGMRTESKEEYSKLLEYYERYIKGSVREISQPPFFDWRDELQKQISQTVSKKFYIEESKNLLRIQTGSQYEAFIDQNSRSTLAISAILSRKDFDLIKTNSKLIQSDAVNIEIHEGGKGYYDMAWGTVKGLKTYNINEPQSDEAPRIVAGIIEFIGIIEKVKRSNF